MSNVIAILKKGQTQNRPVGWIELSHDERHLRRKRLHSTGAGEVMLDLKEPVHLHHGDLLSLDDGRYVEIIAAEEPLMEVRGRDRLHLTELAWHLGNRHLKAQVEEDRLLILRDHVIRDMLERLGATLRDVQERFQPVHGAYHAHGEHHHGNGHHHSHG